MTLLLGGVLKGSGCPSLGPQPSEKQGTRAYLRIPALDPASTSAKAAWKMELDQSSSVSTGVVQLMVTPPADAPVGAYSLTAEHRGESAPLGGLVLLFNPWCPGRSLEPEGTGETSVLWRQITFCPVDRNTRTQVLSTTVRGWYSQSRPAGPGEGAESSVGTGTQSPTQKLVQEKQKNISCYSGGVLWSEIPSEVGHLGQCCVKIVMDVCLCVSSSLQICPR